MLSGDVSMAKGSDGAPNSEAEGILSEEWSVWRVLGKWPTWKVDLCRRREPAWDFGSEKGFSY